MKNKPYYKLQHFDLDFHPSSIDEHYKLNALIIMSKLFKPKYDLIEDFKKVISDQKRINVISKLDSISKEKFKIGDFKGAIKYLRRSWKYY